MRTEEIQPVNVPDLSDDKQIIDNFNLLLRQINDSLVPQLKTNFKTIDLYMNSELGTSPLLLDASNQSSWTPSTTVVTNLNADMVDGYHSSSFSTSGHTHSHAGLTNLDFGSSGHTGFLGVTQAEGLYLLLNQTSPQTVITGIPTFQAGLNIGTSPNYMSLDSAGLMTMNGTAGIVIPHMMQSDSTDQAIADVTTDQIITFDTDVHHNGITRTSSSRFTITKRGSYLITFSGVTKGVINKYIAVWLKVNDANVANSNTLYQYKANGATTIVAVSFLEHFDVGDYFEFWTWGDDVGNSWNATAAVEANPGVTPARPACPSIIITANYVGDD